MAKENLPVSKASASQYLGVSKEAASKKWRAQIRVSGKLQHLGLFSCEKEAARTYDAAARLAFGDFARPNFEGVT